MDRTSARRIDWLILAAWMASLAAVRAGTVEERDPYWQIRAGLEDLANIPLARADSWSWAPVSGLFYPTSPAWNALLALGWRAAGFAGFFAVTFATILIYLVVVVALAYRLRARPLTILAGIVPILLMGLPFLSPRATMASQALVLLAVLAAHQWSARSRSRSPAVNFVTATAGGLAASVAGNWTHLSWIVLSAAVGASWTALWLLTPHLGKTRRIALVIGGSLGLAGGTLLSPYGLIAGIERTRAVQEACSGIILEWAGMFTADLALRWAPAGLAAISLALGAAVWTGRELKRAGPHDPRVPLVAALTVIGLPAALGGLTAIRFTGIALFTLAPIAAMAATALADKAHSRANAEPRSALWRSGRVREWTTGSFWRVVSGVVIVVLLPGTVFLTWPLGRPPTLSVIAALPTGCRLFSPGGTAGPVILLRPDVRVWYDGRADYWGRERLLAANDYLFSANPESPVPPGTTCVLIADSDPGLHLAGLYEALDSDPSWQRVSTVDGATLWLPASSGQRVPEAADSRTQSAFSTR